MKHIFSMLLFCCVALTVNAQQYGNEWIDYSKTYYKFKVADDGLIRIPNATLAAAGLSGLNGSGYKVYYKGQQIPIYVTTSGAFGTGDYVEFYGTKNDGELDTRLFEEEDWQLHDYTSLFSDSISYFLLWDNATASLQYQNITNEITSPPAAEPFFMHTARQVHANTFSEGKPFRLGGANNHFPDFEDGEGFASNNIPAGNSVSYTLGTPSVYGAGDAPLSIFRSKLIGSSDGLGSPLDHLVNTEIDGIQYTSDSFSAYNNVAIEQSIFTSGLNNTNTTVTYNNVSGTTAPSSESSLIRIAFTEITYPHTFDLNNASRHYIKIEDNTDTYLEISNFDGGTVPVVYDLTNNWRIIPIFEDGVYKVRLPQGVNPLQEREIYISSLNTVCTLNNCSFPCFPSECDVWEVASMSSVNFTDYTSVANQGNFVMVTHPNLRTGGIDWVEQYATHRASLQGGAYNVEIVNVEELYDQFAWGVSKHPLSIKNFINYAYDNWSISPEYLFIIGKSVSYQIVYGTPPAYDVCLVPTYGHHPSDNMLVTRFYDHPNYTYVPEIPVGRLSASTPQEVRWYYEKMLEHETQEACDREEREWTKDVIHMVTGHSTAEANIYLGYVENYKNIVEAPLYGGDVIGTFSQASFTPPPQPIFNSLMDEGAALVTFIGHSSTSPGTLDFDIQEPSTYNNEGKYYYMITGSCFVGNIHSYAESSKSLAEKFVIIDDKGAIAFLATVSFGFPDYLDTFSENLYTQFSDINYNQPMGFCTVQAMENMYLADEESIFYNGTKITVQEYTLQGDPAVILKGSYENPEYVIENNSSFTDVILLNPDTGLPLTGSPITIPDGLSNIDVEVTVSNIGQSADEQFQILVQQQLPSGGIGSQAQEIVTAPVNQTTFTISLAVDNSDTDALNNIIVTVDAANEIVEDCEDNNQVIIPVNVESVDCASITPPSIIGLDDSYCGDDGTVALIGIPTGGNFTVNGLPATQLDPTALPSGTNLVVYEYTDPATDCVLFATEEVEVNVAPSTAFTVETDEICAGECFIVALDGGFIAEATYNWDFGTSCVATALNSTETIWQVCCDSPGTVIVSNDVAYLGCNGVTSTEFISIEAPLEVPSVSCTGNDLSSVTFSWSSVTGATGYEIWIDNVFDSVVGAGENTATVTGLVEDQSVNIQVLATGDGACGNSDFSSIQTCVAQSCPPIEIAITNLQTSYCTDDASSTLVGSAGDCTILLDGVELIDNILDPAVISEGPHDVLYICDISECSYSQPYTFDIVATPEPVISGDNFLCPGETTTLSLDATYANYLWTGDFAGSTLEVTEGGTYSVTVTNTGGCSAVDAFVVEAATAVDFDLTSDNGQTVICNSIPLTLVATDGFSSYEWNVPSSANTAIVTEAGNYSVTATDEFSCTYIETIEITEGNIDAPELLANGLNDETNFCEGSSVQLDAGEGFATYAWSVDGENEQTLDITEAGAYTVTVTTSNGCEAENTIDITFSSIAAPSILASATEICEGDAISLDAGEGFESYAWSVTDETDQQLIVTEAGTYEVTVTANNCTAVASIDIEVSPDAIPQAAFALEGNAIACTGDALSIDNLSQNASAYLWTFINDDSGSQITTNEFEPTFDLAPGTYSVSLEATAICGSAIDTQAAEAFITISTAPSVRVITEPTEICLGETILLEGETDAIDYQWLANDEPISNALSFEASPLEETIYTLIATDENGCAAADTVLVGIIETCELPNAITPNNDGFNDMWFIPQAETNENILVEIYNRWGQQVYSIQGYSNITGWDGTSNTGEELPHATYFYVIDLNDGSEAITGTITILN